MEENIKTPDGVLFCTQYTDVNGNRLLKVKQRDKHGKIKYVEMLLKDFLYRIYGKTVKLPKLP